MSLGPQGFCLASIVIMICQLSLVDLQDLQGIHASGPQQRGEYTE